MLSAFTRRLPIFLLLATLIAIVIYTQLPQTFNGNQSYQPVVAVKTRLSALTEYKDKIEAVGTARANEQVFITSKYSDLVEYIGFDDGDNVKKGDVLVRLNSQEEAAKVKELKANLAESVAQLKRFQNLYQQKATAKSLVDQQEAKTKAISAQLLSAKTTLNDLSIKAPFSGKLGFRAISLGSLVKAGDVITSLDDLSIIKVDFAIAERYLTAVKIGHNIEANSIAYPQQLFVGKIISIDSRIDSKTRTLKVRAQIPNADMKLRAGMLLNINIVRDVEQILSIPESAIIPIEDQHFVFVIDKNKAIKKAIKIGRRYQGMVEILSGINVGSEIVIEGALKLRDGSQVKVLEEPL